MIWNKKKDGAENPGAETPAAQTTKAPVLFLQKNWKWLVPVVVAAAAGAVFFLNGGVFAQAQERQHHSRGPQLSGGQP